MIMFLPVLNVTCTSDNAGKEHYFTKTKDGEDEEEDDDDEEDDDTDSETADEDPGCKTKGAIIAEMAKPWRVEIPRFRKKKAGKWRIFYPGKDTCRLPAVVPAKEIVLKAYVPDKYYRDTCGFEQWRSNPNLFLLKGLNYPHVHSMLHDSKGNYWFGDFGYGIAKWDGNYFSTWLYLDGISGQYVEGICEDKKGNIWFAMSDSGLMMFDGIKCTHYTVKNGLSSSRVTSVFCDSKGNIWAGTYGGGLDKFDGKNFTHYRINQGLADDYVLKITGDRNGNLLITTTGGISRFNGIRFANLTWEEGLISGSSWKALEDNKGNLWLSGDGFSKFDGTYFTHYDEADEDDEESVVLDMVFDKNGNLWMGHSLSCIQKFNGKKLSTWHTGRWRADKESCWVMYKDRNQDLWIGAEGIGMMRFAAKDSVSSR